MLRPKGDEANPYLTMDLVAPFVLAFPHALRAWEHKPVIASDGAGAKVLHTGGDSELKRTVSGGVLSGRRRPSTMVECHLPHHRSHAGRRPGRFACVA
jgi:hypothetical protein